MAENIVDYEDLKGSFANNSSTFDGLYDHYVNKKGMSEPDFANLIKSSIWIYGPKTHEWLVKGGYLTEEDYQQAVSEVKKAEEAEKVEAENASLPNPTIDLEPTVTNNTETEKVAPEAVAAEQMENANATETPTEEEAPVEETPVENVVPKASSTQNKKKDKVPFKQRLSNDINWMRYLDLAADFQNKDSLMSPNDYISSVSNGITGVNLPKYMLAGFNHQALPEYDGTKWQENMAKLTDDYYSGKSRRSQKIKDSAADVKAGLEANKQFIRNMSEYKDMPDSVLTFIANHLNDDAMDYDYFMDAIVDATHKDVYRALWEKYYRSYGLLEYSKALEKAKEDLDYAEDSGSESAIEEAKEAYKKAYSDYSEVRDHINERTDEEMRSTYNSYWNAYKSARSQSATSLERESTRRELDSKSLTNTYKALENQAKSVSNLADRQALIQSLRDNINNLRQLKVTNAKTFTVDNYYDTEKQLLSIVAGVIKQSTGGSINIEAGVEAGPVKAGGGASKSKSNVIDSLYNANIPLAVKAADELKNLQAKDYDAWNKFIDEQIQELESTIRNIQRKWAGDSTSMIPGRRTSAEDYQRYMGYDGESPINKDPSYYMERVRGGAANV